MLDTIGDWKVSVIDTGRFWLDGGAMMGSVPKVLWEKTNMPDGKNRIELALRCLLLDNGEKVVLIETGLGNKINSKFRNMFNVCQADDALNRSLLNCGYKPEDISDVILTHLHFDHSGGATKFDSNGVIVPSFPNAIYHVSERNWDIGLNPNPRDKASYLDENYLCIQKTGQLSLIGQDSQIIDSISAISVDGHTFGQQLVKVDGGSDILVFCSDLIPLRSHLKLPWIMGYDLNAYLTLKEKTKFLLDAAKNNWWLYFYHDPNTIAVKVKKSERGYDVSSQVLENE